MVLHAYHYLEEKNVLLNGRLPVWVHQKKSGPTPEKQLSNQLLELTI